MFEEFMGIPAHPLLVHAAVVFVPLLILVALGYALVPPLRRHLWWAAILLGIAAPGAALFAKLSGDAFRARMVEAGTATPDFIPKIDEHRGFGTNLLYLATALGVLVIVLVVMTRPRGAMASGGATVATKNSALSIVLVVLVVAASAAAGYYVFKTGDTGAKMVWTGL